MTDKRDQPTGRAGAVHIVQRMEMGGIQTLALDLVAPDAPRDAIISLEGTADELISAWPKLDGWRDRLHALDIAPGVRPQNALKVARVLRRLKPRAVIVHHIGPMLYGGLGARLAGVPRLIHVEHDVWHYADAGHKRIAKFCARTLRPRHVAVSNAVADGLREVVGDRDVTVIFPGIDMDRFHPSDRTVARARAGLPEDATLVGTAGRLEAVKGHTHLIEALAHLPNYVQVVIAGDGSERPALEAQARALGVSQRLHLLGQRDDVDALLPALDVFALPSLNEGLPRVIMEAQAVGLPVVSSELGAIPTALDLDAGALVPAGDGAALAKAIMDVLARTPRRNATRTFIADRYSLRRTAAAFDALIEDRNR